MREPVYLILLAGGCLGVSFYRYMELSKANAQIKWRNVSGVHLNELLGGTF